MREATRVLEEELIIKCSNNLDLYYYDISLRTTYLRDEFPKLITYIHRKVFF